MALNPENKFGSVNNSTIDTVSKERSDNAEEDLKIGAYQKLPVQGSMDILTNEEV